MHPTGQSTAQQARNLLMDLDEQAHPGPHPHLEPSPSAASPRRLRGPPQSAPATPLPARRRAAETATRTRRSCTVPHPKTGQRQWPDQRISPGRMTWTRFRHAQVKFMIRDRGSNYTAVFDSVLADAGIPDRALQGPDAPHERHRRTLDPGDAAASSWTAPSSGTRSQPVPCPKARSRQWHDQRIPAGRMRWTRFSAPTGPHQPA